MGIADKQLRYTYTEHAHQHIIAYPGFSLNNKDMGIADQQLRYTYTEHAHKHMISYSGL